MDKVRTKTAFELFLIESAFWEKAKCQQQLVK